MIAIRQLCWGLKPEPTAKTSRTSCCDTSGDTSPICDQAIYGMTRSTRPPSTSISRSIFCSSMGLAMPGERMSRSTSAMIERFIYAAASASPPYGHLPSSRNVRSTGFFLVGSEPCAPARVASFPSWTTSRGGDYFSLLSWGGGYPPLTAPAVSPATIWRCARTVSSSTGKVTISAAAASGPQLN
jgi:hypothetical protein